MYIKNTGGVALKRIICACLAATLVLLCLSCCGKEKKYTEYSFDYFDTVTSVTGYAPSKAEFDKAVSLIMSELEVYHKLCDIYNEYDGVNNLATVNKLTDGGHGEIKVDGRIIDLIEFSREMYRLTDGRTNIAMGSVLSVWHRYREAGKEVPPEDVLKEASDHCDINDVITDRENSTVYLADSEMTLDVGAVAKGYAVEQTAKLLEVSGVTGYVLNVGGNVRCIGPQADGSPWTVGVENPREGDAYVAKLALEDASLVTSGDYQRYYTVDGVRYHHIIDSETLFPSERFASVSVLSDDSGIADALSTALFSMDVEEGMSLVRTLENTYAMWVKTDGTVCYSAGFEDYTE